MRLQSATMATVWNIRNTFKRFQKYDLGIFVVVCLRYSKNTKKIWPVKRKCKFRAKKKVWIAAWVTAIRAPKAGGRCYEKPKHLRVLKKWKRAIKKQNCADRTT